MPCNASYARFIFGKFFTSTIILYVLLFAQKVLFLQKVGVTKGCLNHDASFTSKALITSAHVGGHDANPTNVVSSTLEFALSSLIAASDEQYERDCFDGKEVLCLA
jgi:hypothetical protein